MAERYFYTGLDGTVIDVLLRQRGRTAQAGIDYRVVDDVDADPPYLTDWNAAVAGPVPTQAEIDAAIAARADILNDVNATRLVDDGEKAMLRALCGTLLWQRLNRQPSGAEFSAEWTTFRQRFITVYKAVN